MVVILTINMKRPLSVVLRARVENRSTEFERKVRE